LGWKIRGGKELEVEMDGDVGDRRKIQEQRTCRAAEDQDKQVPSDNLLVR
jgi:hypothetical protein